MLAAAPPDVDVGGWFKAGWDLFVKNAGPAIGIPLVALGPAIILVVLGYIGTVIVAVLSDTMRGGAVVTAVASLGALIGLLGLIVVLVMPALWAGICACFLAGIRTGKLTTDNLGVGFRNWWACTWVVWLLYLGILLCVPFLLILVGLPLIFALISLGWLAVFRIVDRNCGGGEALEFAWNAMRGRLWMMLLFTFIVVALIYAGQSAMLVGIVVTTPIGIAAFAAGYDALTRQAVGKP